MMRKIEDKIGAIYMGENGFFSWFWSFFKEYSWAAQSLIILVITLGVVYAESIIHKKLKPKLQRKKKLWELAILSSIHKPLCVLLWFLGIIFSIQVLSTYAPEDFLFFKLLPHARKIGVVFISVWFFVGFIKEIESLLTVPREGKRRLDKTTIRAIGQVLRVIVVVGSIFIIMQSIFGVGASAILAFAGGGGITIGWAAKDMLANFFGGLMIFLDRPFVIGDRIASKDKDIEGVVEHIGWRLTRIKTLEKVPLYVPNAIFLNITVKNPTRMSHRRIRTFIGIRYKDADKMSSIVRDVKDVLKNHKDIDQKQMLLVNFANFGPSSLDFLIHCFTESIAYSDFIVIQEEIFFSIMKIIKSHGAEIAFPTTTVHLSNPESLALDKA